MICRVFVMAVQCGKTRRWLEASEDGGRDFVFILSITQHWTDGDDVTR
jgi:hypothetical protein